VFLPVVGAPLLHAPVLRWDLLPALRRPINRRLFGENKTWRGALVMTTGTVAASLVLDRVPWYRRRLNELMTEGGPVRIGVLLGSSCWIGELPNSFVKRRLGIPPGQQRRSLAGAALSIFDQADWVPAAWLMLRPVIRLTGPDAARAFAVVGAIHVPINLVGYAVGARTSPR
jgi:hypothetical protein